LSVVGCQYLCSQLPALSHQLNLIWLAAISYQLSVRNLAARVTTVVERYPLTSSRQL